MMQTIEITLDYPVGPQCDHTCPFEKEAERDVTHTEAEKTMQEERQRLE